jgi:hypothetical protein
MIRQMHSRHHGGRLHHCFFSPEFVSARAAFLDFTGIYDESLLPVSQVTLALSFPVT